MLRWKIRKKTTVGTAAHGRRRDDEVLGRGGDRPPDPDVQRLPARVVPILDQQRPEEVLPDRDDREDGHDTEDRPGHRQRQAGRGQVLRDDQDAGRDHQRGQHQQEDDVAQDGRTLESWIASWVDFRPSLNRKYIGPMKTRAPLRAGAGSPGLHGPAPGLITGRRTAARHQSAGTFRTSTTASSGRPAGEGQRRLPDSHGHRVRGLSRAPRPGCAAGHHRRGHGRPGRGPQ